MPPSAYVGDPNDADDVRGWQSFGSFFEIFSIEILLPSTESATSGVHGIDSNNLVSWHYHFIEYTFLHLELTEILKRRLYIFLMVDTKLVLN